MLGPGWYLCKIQWKLKEDWNDRARNLAACEFNIVNDGSSCIGKKHNISYQWRNCTWYWRVSRFSE